MTQSRTRPKPESIPADAVCVISGRPIQGRPCWEIIEPIEELGGKLVDLPSGELYAEPPYINVYVLDDELKDQGDDRLERIIGDLYIQHLIDDKKILRRFANYLIRRIRS